MLSRTAALGPGDRSQEPRSGKLRSLILVGGTFLIVAALFGSILVLVNPFDCFLQRSEDFTVEKFLAIRAGMDLSTVLEALGDPIRVNSDLPGFVVCPDCSAYCFLGEPPDWLIAHREAWVLVDRDGKVVSRILVDEP